MYQNFFINSSVNGRLGCFHVLAVVNSAAVYNGIHVSFSILFSSGYNMPRSGIPESYGGFIPNFLRNLHTVFSEKAMATHSSNSSLENPRTEEPGRLQSMWSLGVRHDWATSLSLFTLMHWRRKWQPTPVFLSGESQGRGSLVGCRLMGSHRVGHD